jgi:vacuolar-type H+-ATPase catalytic subunit A/Vma1
MDPVDSYSTVQKQVGMLGLMMHFHDRAHAIIKRGALISVIRALPVVNVLIRMKVQVPNEALDQLDIIRQQIDEQMDKLEMEYR